MPVDVFVFAGLQDGADIADAYDTREQIARDLARAPVREVGGGTTFEPLVADAQFEAQNSRDALLTVGVLAASLLKQGFAVRTPSGKLVVSERSTDGDEPLPGVAHVEIVAPLGQP